MEIEMPVTGDTIALAQDAFIWGLPLVMMGRYLDAAVSAGVPFNQFFMNAEVATPQSRAVGPNIDTLNGRAWFDLTDGPVLIGVPDTADRYYSIQFQDMYMNSFAYIGRRTSGTKAGVFAITPPDFDGVLPPSVTEVRATNSKILVFVRTLVSGPEDMSVARALNASFTTGTLSSFAHSPTPSIVASGALDAFQPKGRRESGRLPHEEIMEAGASFFEELNRLVHQFPPSAEDARHLARFVPLGVGGQQGVASPADLAAALSPGLAIIMSSLRTWAVNGWMRRENVASFIHDPVQRSANNIYGPNTQIAEESIFFNKRLDDAGQPLSGANHYRLRFPPGQTPPVDAFWSLTLYDKAYVLFDNIIDRYGITDRSPLRYGADGSLDIRIQPDAPEGEDLNWLPAPRDGFQLVLRTYQPREALLDGSYMPPPLDIVDAH